MIGERNRISVDEAREIARSFVRSATFLSEWEGASLASVFPVFSPNGKQKPTYYEFKVSSPDVTDAGFVLVCATDEFDPVPAFKPSGKSTTEELRALSACEDIKVVLIMRTATIGIFYAIAVNQNGEEVARYEHSEIYCS